MNAEFKALRERGLPRLSGVCADFIGDSPLPTSLVVVPLRRSAAAAVSASAASAAAASAAFAPQPPQQRFLPSTFGKRGRVRQQRLSVFFASAAAPVPRATVHWLTISLLLLLRANLHEPTIEVSASRIAIMSAMIEMTTPGAAKPMMIALPTVQSDAGYFSLGSVVTLNAGYRQKVPIICASFACEGVPSKLQSMQIRQSPPALTSVESSRHASDKPKRTHETTIDASGSVIAARKKRIEGTLSSFFVGPTTLRIRRDHSTFRSMCRASLERITWM